MGMLQIGDKYIREENITYVEHVSMYHDDGSKQDPDDFYGDRVPKAEYKVACIHFIGGGPPLEISSEKGLSVISEFLASNPSKKLG